MQLLPDDVRIHRCVAQLAAQGKDLALVVELVCDDVRENLKGRSLTRFVVEHIPYFMHLRRIHLQEEFIHQVVYRIKQGADVMDGFPGFVSGEDDFFFQCLLSYPGFIHIGDVYQQVAHTTSAAKGAVFVDQVFRVDVSAIVEEDMP